ncbi:MAG: DUF998 domain-containing protein, partial [Candidatus Thorarchaeota archaeon]
LAPSFDWGSDALSHLGHWFRTDIGPNPEIRAFTFNGGLVIGGCMIVFYFLSLARETKFLPSKIAFLGPATTGLLLVGVGIFSENISLGHMISALGFFFSIPISAALLGITWVIRKEVRIYGVIILVITFLVVAIFSPWTSLAIWEFTISFIAWIEFWFIIAIDAKGYLEVLKKK